MSLLSRDELRVVIYRDQLQLVRMTSRLTLKGWLHQVQDKQMMTFEADAELPWSRAIDKLEAILAGAAIKPESASVVLSNQFLRYAIVDVNPDLKDEEEQHAYVKHRFGQLYGASADSWELRLDQEYPGSPYFASAVEAQLISSLREMFKRVNVRLQSIQPCLMKAYNQCHPVFKTANAWFVLFEHGNLCVMWLKDGHPQSVRTTKVGDNWLEIIPEILDRETYLSELEVSSKEIFLCSFGSGKLDMPKSGRWNINRIQPAVASGLLGQYDEQYALAMCG